MSSLSAMRNKIGGVKATSQQNAQNMCAFFEVVARNCKGSFKSKDLKVVIVQISRTLATFKKYLVYTVRKHKRSPNIHLLDIRVMNFGNMSVVETSKSQIAMCSIMTTIAL